MKGTYPESAQGNFKVIDTIGVPHAYCITPKHVVVASDHWGGRLGEEAIKDAEENHGAKCDICRVMVKEGRLGKVLSYKEHETALLVECKIEINPTPDELQKWLLSIKDEATANGYAGFAFKKAS